MKKFQIVCFIALSLSVFSSSRSQSILTADGLAVFGTNAPSGGGGGGFPTSGNTFDVRYNGNLNDSSGNGNNFSQLGGSATYGTDEVSAANKAVLLDGTADYNGLSDATVANYTGDCTISIWFKCTVANFDSQQNLFSKGQFGNTGYRCYLKVANGGDDLAAHIIFESNPSAATVTSSDRAIALNTWYNVIITVSGTTATIYINGVSDASGTITLPASNTSEALWVGKYTGGGSFFKGNIAEVSGWNRALNSTERGIVSTASQ